MNKWGSLLKSEWKLFLFVVVMAALMIRLGLWQLSRYDEKLSLETSIETRMLEKPLIIDQKPFFKSLLDDSAWMEPLIYRQVQLCGAYQNNKTVLLDNRTQQGKAGYYVFSPFKTCSGEMILIHRGWVSRVQGTLALPPLPALPSEQITIKGQFIPVQKPSWLTLPLEFNSAIQWPLIIQNFTPQDIKTLYGGEYSATDMMVMQNLHVQLQAFQPGGLKAVPVSVATTSEKHFGYAVQWFSMTTVLLLLFLYRLYRVQQHRSQLNEDSLVKETSV